MTYATMTCVNRRMFLSAAAAGLVRVAHAQPQNVPEVIRNLRPMTDGIQPITMDERRARIEKARTLMRADKINAVVMEGGSSMFYFTGTRKAATERLFALVIPVKGEIAWVV